MEFSLRGFLGFIAGLLFAVGLIVSGMSNPSKVLNFLDVAGAWDPTLALVSLVLVCGMVVVGTIAVASSPGDTIVLEAGEYALSGASCRAPLPRCFQCISRPSTP